MTSAPTQAARDGGRLTRRRPWVEDPVLRDRRHTTARAARDVADWLSWLDLGGHSPRTLDQYERDLAVLLNAFPDRALAEFTDGDLALAITSEVEKIVVGSVVSGLESAWGLIANSYHGDWESAPKEWREAAGRWRDDVWHYALLLGLLPRGVSS